MKVFLKSCVYAAIVIFCIMSCKKAKISGEPLEKPVVSVAAAANLRDVLQELGQAYIAEDPGRKVELTFGSSGLLVQQIFNGAPFDLFLSADTSFPEKLQESGKTYGNAKVYAYGKIVLWSSKQDVSQGLKILLNPEIKKIAIANPQLAPYGRNTVEALKKSGLYHKIENKIVWAENINQTAQFASTGNADVGFIALSNAKNKEMTARGKFYELTEEECLPIAQSGIILKNGNNRTARDFFNFITSRKAVKIWKHYGYQTETNH